MGNFDAFVDEDDDAPVAPPPAEGRYPGKSAFAPDRRRSLSHRMAAEGETLAPPPPHQPPPLPAALRLPDYAAAEEAEKVRAADGEGEPAVASQPLP